MPPSLRLPHPTSTTPQPIPSTSLVPPSSSHTQSVPFTPSHEASQSLRFYARVPTPGMHSSNHSSDCVRSHLHLPNPRVVDIDPLSPIEFDGLPPPRLCGKAES